MKLYDCLWTAYFLLDLYAQVNRVNLGQINLHLTYAPKLQVKLQVNPKS